GKLGSGLTGQGNRLLTRASPSGKNEVGWICFGSPKGYRRIWRLRWRRWLWKRSPSLRLIVQRWRLTAWRTCDESIYEGWSEICGSQFAPRKNRKTRKPREKGY